MDTPKDNAWCRALQIAPPRLEEVVSHPQANTFALLLVALLEAGQPMTLPQVAARLAEVGVMSEAEALRSLRRCRPDRDPVYRDGDLYTIDPHSDGLAYWSIRLDLRPPRVARPEPAPLPGLDVPLSSAELDEAWKDASLTSWALRRLALAVLDTNGGPLAPAAVVAAVSARTSLHRLREAVPDFARRGSPVQILDDGRWAVSPGADAAVVVARKAVRERIAMVRRYRRMDPGEIAASMAAYHQRSEEAAAAVAAQRRAILVAWPTQQPAVAVVADLGARSLRSFFGAELAGLPEALAPFDVLAAVDVRALLRAVGVQPGERRLAELGPPQKTRQLDSSGRKLTITTAMLARGSCGVDLGDERALEEGLARGDLREVARLLESDAKALCAMYQYGCLHGVVRLRWGALDERIIAPWASRHETGLPSLKKAAVEHGLPLEIVEGSAPDWADPWARARRVTAAPEAMGWDNWLLDEDGNAVDEEAVQLARLVGPEDGVWE